MTSTYIGVSFKVKDYKNYTIHKYIESEDINDIKKLLDLRDVV